MNPATMLPVHDHEQWYEAMYFRLPGEEPDLLLHNLYAHDERCPGACGPCGGEGGIELMRCLTCGGDGRCRGCNSYVEWEWRWRLQGQDSYMEQI